MPVMPRLHPLDVGTGVGAGHCRLTALACYTRYAGVPRASQLSAFAR